MSDSLDALIRDLHRFDRKREVVRCLRIALRRPLPALRASIRARALATLPGRGGLARWVAAARITASFRSAGRTAGVRVTGSRKSLKGKSDLRRLDAGRVRAPSWGRRTAASWHTQAVTPGYFTSPAAETGQWAAAASRAVDDALEMIRRG